MAFTVRAEFYILGVQGARQVATLRGGERHRNLGMMRAHNFRTLQDLTPEGNWFTPIRWECPYGKQPRG